VRQTLQMSSARSGAAWSDVLTPRREWRLRMGGGWRTGGWSGRPDSNRRHQPWQGCTLPAELLPLARDFFILAPRPLICQFAQELAAEREHFPREMVWFSTAPIERKLLNVNRLQICFIPPWQRLELWYSGCRPSKVSCRNWEAQGRKWWAEAPSRANLQDSN